MRSPLVPELAAHVLDGLRGRAPRVVRGFSDARRVLPATVLILVACGNETNDGTEHQPAPASESAEAGAPALVGFYRVDGVRRDGAVVSLREELTKHVKGDMTVDHVRMTIRFEPGKLTVGLEQVFGDPGHALYCSVQAGSDITIDGAAFSCPGISAFAAAGSTDVTGDSTGTDTATCNVSLSKGDYTIKHGTPLELTTTMDDGETWTLLLVEDTAEIDLEARAKAFAQQVIEPGH